ncbi:metal-dependent hydrolase [Orenia marismortui]|uniref:metal-dependent hydrolase n=1 Tax=Orenia marismortui TaxID=46469 RepID=UPI00037E0E4E|nr:metal-dependent hydrolase [Orenia marismortui]
MTAPTHSIFSIMIIFLFGLSFKDVGVFIILGSLLPDIDHPQSTIGRVFFFISHPINKSFGHRNLTHSLVLWIPVIILGSYLSQPILWVGVGAFSHLILDSWNVSGVGLFKPITDKIFVMAGKKYRVRVGSKQELIIMVCLVLVTLGSFHLNEVGGFRGLVRELIADYNIALKEYQKQGTKVCYMEGKIRHSNGRLEEGKWLIIGQNEYYTSLSLYDEKNNEVFSIYDDASFLRAHLRASEESWNTLKLKEPMEVAKGEVFYKISKDWHRATKGDYVLGNVVYLGEISLDVIEESNN